MICYVLAMGKQHLGPHVVVGYGIKIFWPGLFITSPDHLVSMRSLTGSPIFWDLKQNSPGSLVYQPLVKGNVDSSQ